MKILALAVGLVVSLTACLPQAREGDKCNNPGETRVEGQDVYKCLTIPGEMQKNFFGKQFPVARWKKMEVK